MTLYLLTEYPNTDDERDSLVCASCLLDHEPAVPYRETDRCERCHRTVYHHGRATAHALGNPGAMSHGPLGPAGGAHSGPHSLIMPGGAALQ